MISGPGVGWGGGLTIFAPPASPLSLIRVTLPPFPYTFTLPTPFICAHRSTPPPWRRSRSRRSQHLARLRLNPKLPQGPHPGQGRRRRQDAEEDVCTDDDNDEKNVVMHKRAGRRGNGELMLHSFLVEFRGLRLTLEVLDRIRWSNLNLDLFSQLIEFDSNQIYLDF
jgi:hypothetical protein